jgi:hypothetical protein
MNSASLCSLAGRYENPIPPRCLAPIDFLKIPAQDSVSGLFLIHEGKSLRLEGKLRVNKQATKDQLGNRLVAMGEKFFSLIFYPYFLQQDDDD